MEQFCSIKTVLAILSLVIAQVAHAAPENTPKTKHRGPAKDKKSDTISTSAAAPTSGGINSTRSGLGLSSSSTIIGSSALSSIHLLDEMNMIQTYFGVSGSEPFVFGMGGVYKHTISGGRRAGLHVGGGLGLGTTAATAAGLVAGGGTTDFFINFVGNTGAHFVVPGLDQLMMSFDAGLALNIVDGNASLQIGPFSEVLGLSVHWLL